MGSLGEINPNMKFASMNLLRRWLSSSFLEEGVTGSRGGDVSVKTGYDIGTAKSHLVIEVTKSQKI